MLHSVTVIEDYLKSSLEKDVEICISHSKFNDIKQAFNITEYFSRLKTERIGKIVLFSEMAKSTMNVLTS